jgi:hypothetical protein
MITALLAGPAATGLVMAGVIWMVHVMPDPLMAGTGGGAVALAPLEAARP